MHAIVAILYKGQGIMILASTEAAAWVGDAHAGTLWLQVLQIRVGFLAAPSRNTRCFEPHGASSMIVDSNLVKLRGMGLSLLGVSRDLITVWLVSLLIVSLTDFV